MVVLGGGAVSYERGTPVQGGCRTPLGGGGLGCGVKAVWGVGCGVWCVVCGVWCVVCGVWGVGCGLWGVGFEI